ncbi:MAG: hypothetical protein AB8B74_08840 [Crocinitomicaceae bacterium]
MKYLKIVLLLIILVGLFFVTFNLIGQKKSSLSSEALSDFAIKDTASIDRIRVSSNAGGLIDFIKEDGLWNFIDGGCMQQHMLRNFLETIKYVAIKGPVPKGSIETVNKQTLSKHKKIEIFQNGKLTKTWFIGTTTADHYGTYMVLKEEGIGISPEPFITFQPNVYGNLADQFSLRRKDYECSGIFVYDNLLDITEIDVVVHYDTSRSFKIVALDSNKFELYQNTIKIDRFDTAKVRSYITGFVKMHYDVKEPIIPKEIRDSTIASEPYYTITVKDSKKSTTLITHLKDPVGVELDYEGNLVEIDRDNLFGVMDNGDFVMIQYFVFDKAFKTLDYFKEKN